MMRLKRLAATVAAVLVSVAMLAGCGNIDTYNTEYDYAYILMPIGDIVEGTVDGWKDYAAGYLQITINDVTYLTDTTRAVLIHNEVDKDD